MRRHDATCVLASSLAVAGSLRVVLGTLVLLTTTSGVSARAIFNWNAPGPGNGNFGNPFIWSPNGPPGPEHGAAPVFFAELAKRAMH